MPRKKKAAQKKETEKEGKQIKKAEKKSVQKKDEEKKAEEQNKAEEKIARLKAQIKKSTPKKKAVWKAGDPKKGRQRGGGPLGSGGNGGLGRR